MAYRHVVLVMGLYFWVRGVQTQKFSAGLSQLPIKTHGPCVHGLESGVKSIGDKVDP